MITVTFDVENAAQAAALLAKLGGTEAVTQIAEPARRGRPPKAAAAAAEEETDGGLGLDTEEETEEETEESYTLDAVIDAFKRYAKKTSREKALAVLTKFKVKSVQHLKEAQYPAVMAIVNK